MNPNKQIARWMIATAVMLASVAAIGSFIWCLCANVCSMELSTAEWIDELIRLVLALFGICGFVFVVSWAFGEG